MTNSNIFEDGFKYAIHNLRRMLICDAELYAVSMLVPIDCRGKDREFEVVKAVNRVMAQKLENLYD